MYEIVAASTSAWASRELCRGNFLEDAPIVPTAALHFSPLADREWVDDRAIFEALFSSGPPLKLAGAERRGGAEAYYRPLVARR